MLTGPPDPREDSQLLAAITDGDRAAFAELYRRHLPWLLVRLGGRGQVRRGSSLRVPADRLRIQVPNGHPNLPVMPAAPATRRGRASSVS